MRKFNCFRIFIIIPLSINPSLLWESRNYLFNQSIINPMIIMTEPTTIMVSFSGNFNHSSANKIVNPVHNIFVPIILFISFINLYVIFSLWEIW
jgi:hypothetical protein